MKPQERSVSELEARREKLMSEAFDGIVNAVFIAVPLIILSYFVVPRVLTPRGSFDYLLLIPLSFFCVGISFNFVSGVLNRSRARELDPEIEAELQKYGIGHCGDLAPHAHSSQDLLLYSRKSGLSYEQITRIFNRYKIDPVSLLILKLETAPNDMKTQIAEELTSSLDDRARDALQRHSDKLARIQLAEDIGFSAEPERIAAYREKLVKGLASLPVSGDKEICDFQGTYARAPRDYIRSQGVEQTADKSVERIQLTAQRIMKHVPGVERLEVRCSFGNIYPERLTLPLFRCFKNGRSDFIPCEIIRADSNEYLIGFLAAD